MEIMIFLLIVLALDVASLRWGFNSRDTWDSVEWERRRYLIF